MPQIVSRTATSNEAPIGRSDLLKRSLLIGFHGAAATTYGYAICWQNVSNASAQLYLKTHPLMRVYGKWRFLTYNCLIMQFVAYSLCLTSHFVPKLRKTKDFFFTTFALPIGMLVVFSFWTIWYVAGREYIFPSALEPYYPPWLNHVTHTIIAPVNAVELLAYRHQYSSDRKSIVCLLAYTASYTSFLVYIRTQTGRWVYPFLNSMDSVPIGAFIASTMIFGLIIYKGSQIIHDLYHGVKSTKNIIRLFTKNARQKKD